MRHIASVTVRHECAAHIIKYDPLPKISLIVGELIRKGATVPIGPAARG